MIQLNNTEIKKVSGGEDSNIICINHENDKCACIALDHPLENKEKRKEQEKLISGLLQLKKLQQDTGLLFPNAKSFQKKIERIYITDCKKLNTEL